MDTQTQLTTSPPQSPPQPQSIYSYLKIDPTQENIYTKEYFQGLEVDIFYANPIGSGEATQSGGSKAATAEALPMSGPYKYFNYFFNNIKTGGAQPDAATAQQPPPPPPPDAAAAQQQQQPPPPEPATPQKSRPHETFIFIKNTYSSPKPLDPTTLDINDLERLAKTLTIQLKLHENAGHTFTEIREQDILSTNQSFIFFPQQSAAAAQTPAAAAAPLGTFLQKIAQQIQPPLPQQTKVVYFIKRALEENVILWT